MEEPIQVHPNMPAVVITWMRNECSKKVTGKDKHEPQK